jgi:hypothetical protein
MNNSKEIALLGYLYNEMRSYREKEFQTFLFAFPILGTGLLPQFASIRYIDYLLVLFSSVIIFYIIKNQIRVTKIKKAIVNLQEELKLNDKIQPLNPLRWVEKGFFSHLGTISYLLILIIETVLIWLS